MSSKSSPNLSALPVEIRKEILHWAFIAICSQPSTIDPEGLSLSPTINFHPPLQAKYGQWGREPMTRILRLNHQLYHEAIDILYRNRFVFLTAINIRSSEGSRNFFKTIGEKVERIQNITVEMNIHVEVISEVWKYARHENRENLAFLCCKMNGVRNVRFIPIFTLAWGVKLDGSEVSKFLTMREGHGEVLEGRLMEFVNFFQREGTGPIAVQIDPAYSQRVGGSVDIIKACRERPIGGLGMDVYVPDPSWSRFDPTV